MGRKNGRRQVPQRSRLVAHRELCRAIKGERPHAFGIRRGLEADSAQKLLLPLHLITKDNAWPEGVEARPSLHVTLMPRRKLDAQLHRGLVLGYKFAQDSLALQHELEENSPRTVICELGKVALFKNKYFGLHIKSEELEAERMATLKLLSGLGLRGAMRELCPLHITVAESDGQLSRAARLETIDMLTTMLPIGDDVVLNPLDFYPNPRQ